MSLLPSKNAAQDPKRRALGRGLEVLLPQREAPPVATADGKPLEIPVDLIERNPFQTRTHFDPEKLTELAASIAASGVVQPIVVRPLPEGRYQLITGERRLIASKQAKKETIPAIVRVVSDEQAMEMTIVENLQRADLNPIEQARAFFRLGTDFRMTQEQMATRTGKDRASVGNFLRLLKLPELVQDKVETGDLSFGHARALLSLPPERILTVAQKVIALSLSVRQTESYITNVLNPELKNEKDQKPEPKIDANVGEAQNTLQRALGMRVRIEDRGGKGRVLIDYADLDDFERIFAALNAPPAS